MTSSRADESSPDHVHKYQKKMSQLSHAKITAFRSQERGAANHGWLDTKHTFNFASYQSGRERFGCLRVLNEDRVAPRSGFPTHPHRNFEIFSYILSGELTHRDSMLKTGVEAERGKDDFCRMCRGDVQFTTGGRGIAHSEQNENSDQWVHFLQIWALPWAEGLTPRYHTRSIAEGAKRQRFVKILSPLKAGPGASEQDEAEAIPSVDETIPIHADLIMAAGIIEPTKRLDWIVGATDEGNIVRKLHGRRVYIHVPMTKNGRAHIKLDHRKNLVLDEGDGAFVENVDAGDMLTFASVGDAEAEVIILDID